MTRDIITNKWIIGAIAFLIIFAGACYLWYRYDTAPYRQEAAESAKLLRQQEAAKKVDTVNEAVQAAEKAPAESNTQHGEKPLTNATGAETEISSNEQTEAVTASMQETEKTEIVKVSPYGFGPYPKLPDGYPGGEDPNFWSYDWDKNDELMIRVSIKLWEQGKKTHGEAMENGLVYPTYPNTLIVKWKTQRTPFGTRRYASMIQGSPETESWQDSHRGTIYESDIPEHFTVIEYKDAGIDPYEFLDLP